MQLRADSQSRILSVNIPADLPTIAADRASISEVLGNLIDNAIKYSPSKEVIIQTQDENIIFENSGNELKFPLENYFEPFFSNEDKQKDSFGLGLYIIHNILKANNYSLEYEYLNGINRFICKKDKLSTI